MKIWGIFHHHQPPFLDSSVQRRQFHTTDMFGVGRGQTLTIFIAIYCWPTISTFWGISLCCCCVSLKKVNNILLVLCWCQWKRAILCCYCLVHIDPYIVEHIAKLLTTSFKLCFIFLFPYSVFCFSLYISSSLLKNLCL